MLKISKIRKQQETSMFFNTKNIIYYPVFIDKSKLFNIIAELL